jgi:hypothetical protein
VCNGGSHRYLSVNLAGNRTLDPTVGWAESGHPNQLFRGLVSSPDCHIVLHKPDHFTFPPLSLYRSCSVMSQAEETPEACVDCNNSNQNSVVAKADSEKGVIDENPLDAATFIPPIPHPAPSVIIEFCDRVSAVGFAYDLLNDF